MSKQNEKPKNILDALGSRADENEPEPTMDETMMEAMLDDKTEAMIGEKPPQIPPTQQQGPPPIQPVTNEVREKIEKAVEEEETTNTSSLQEKEKPTIPASNTESQPATETSSPDSPGQDQTIKIEGDGSDFIIENCTFIDKNLCALDDFVHSPMFDVNWVRSHIARLSQFPEVLPSPISWDIPGSIDLAELVYEKIIEVCEGYFVEMAWPALCILMNKSIDNVEWTAGILCTLALFDVINELPDKGRNHFR